MDSSKSKPKEESIIPINESLNFNQDQEDMFNNSSLPFTSSQKLKNSKSKDEIDFLNEKEDDPNFADSKLKKEEEARRRKAVEEFEKRKMQKKNNIIDYDEINENKYKTKNNKNDTQVDDEGIIIESFNYVSKPKINNINYKNSLCKKNKEVDDLESKITQIKQITSYSKDDLNINSSPEKNKNE